MEQSNIPGAKMKQPETGMKHRFLLLFGILLIVSLAIMGNIRATTYECDSCESCSDLLFNSCDEGNIILLNQSITSTTDCIVVELCENTQTFDCQGFTIEGSYNFMSGYKGLSIDSTSYSIIQNCIIKGFGNGFSIVGSSLNEIRNMTITDYVNALVIQSSINNEFYDNIIISNRSVGSIVWFNNGITNLFYNNTFNVSGIDPLISCIGSCNNTWNDSNYGNAWFLNNGTGYSQICINDNNDSFCDFKYEIDSNNIDYKPFTTNFTYEIPGPPESIILTINQPQNISYYEGFLTYNATTNITANSICLSTDGNLTYPICSYNVSMLYGTINITPGFYNWTFRANNSNTVYDTVFFTINETPEEETPGPISNETIIFQIDSNLDSTITKYLCSDNNTLKIESNTQYCISGSGNFTPNCYWINKTKYQNCAYGCYPGVVENGDYCSPPDYILWGFGLIVFFVAIFLINRYYRGR